MSVLRFHVDAALNRKPATMCYSAIVQSWAAMDSNLRRECAAIAVAVNPRSVDSEPNAFPVAFLIDD